MLCVTHTHTLSLCLSLSFSSLVRPTPFKTKNLKLIAWDKDVAKLLGLPSYQMLNMPSEPPKAEDSPTDPPQAVILPTELSQAGILVKELSGQRLISTDRQQDGEQYAKGNEKVLSLQYFAHCYGGHQFGSFSGQLGDGRAMSIGWVAFLCQCVSLSLCLSVCLCLSLFCVCMYVCVCVCMYMYWVGWLSISLSLSLSPSLLSSLLYVRVCVYIFLSASLLPTFSLAFRVCVCMSLFPLTHVQTRCVRARVCVCVCVCCR